MQDETTMDKLMYCLVPFRLYLVESCAGAFCIWLSRILVVFFLVPNMTLAHDNVNIMTHCHCWTRLQKHTKGLQACATLRWTLPKASVPRSVDGPWTLPKASVPPYPITIPIFRKSVSEPYFITKYYSPFNLYFTGVRCAYRLSRYSSSSLFLEGQSPWLGCFDVWFHSNDWQPLLQRY